MPESYKQLKEKLIARNKEINQALVLLNTHLSGRVYTSLDDALRNLLQIYVSMRDNAAEEASNPKTMTSDVAYATYQKYTKEHVPTKNDPLRTYSGWLTQKHITVVDIFECSVCEDTKLISTPLAGVKQRCPNCTPQDQNAQ